MSETVIVFAEGNKIKKEVDPNFTLPARYNNNGEMVQGGGESILCLLEDTHKFSLSEEIINSLGDSIYYIQHEGQGKKEEQLLRLKEQLKTSTALFRQDNGFHHMPEDDIWDSLKKIVSQKDNKNKKKEIDFLLEYAKRSNIQQSLDKYVALRWLLDVPNKPKEDENWISEQLGGVRFREKERLARIRNFNDMRRIAEEMWIKTADGGASHS